MAKQSTQRQKQCNDDKELLRKKKNVMEPWSPMSRKELVCKNKDIAW